jgi:hypothetical protein
LRNIHVAGLSFDGRQAVDPRQPFEAADRLCLATTPLSARISATLIPIKFFLRLCASQTLPWFLSADDAD